MLKKIIIVFLCFISYSVLWAQTPQAYVLFDAKGNKVDYQTMIKQMSKKDVVFIGEIHNCPIAH